MPFNFGSFWEGLKKAKFKNTNRSKEKAFRENIATLKDVWEAGNQNEVKKIAGAIYENIKLCDVDPSIKNKLIELKDGKLKPPPAPLTTTKVHLQKPNPTTSTNDVPNKSDLSSIQQKAKEKELEITKMQLSELARDVNNLHELIFKTKEKLLQSRSLDHVIEQTRAQISKIKDEVSKREDLLKRCKEENTENLKQVYKDVMKTDYKAVPKQDMFEQMTSDFMKMIERSRSETVNQLYKDIKGRDFVVVSTADTKRGGKAKGSKSDTSGQNLTSEITKELKEDINRLDKLKPKLEKMFNEITGKDYTLSCDLQQGKQVQGKGDPNLKEDEIIKDMTHQLKEFNSRKMAEFTKDMYKEIKGQEFPLSATSKKDEKGKKADTCGEKVIQEIKNDLRKDFDRLKKVKPTLEEMFNSITEERFSLRSDGNQGNGTHDLDEIEMLQNMTHRLKEFIDGKMAGLTKDLYEEIKGKEFPKIPSSGASKKDNKRDKIETGGEKEIQGIKNELKKDIDRLKEVKPKLVEMFKDITGGQYKPISRQQGNNTQELNEIEMLQDITQQLKKYTKCQIGLGELTEMLEILFNDVFNSHSDSRDGDFTKQSESRKETNSFDNALRDMSGRMKQCLKKKLSGQIDPSVVEEEAKRLYNLITEDKKSLDASMSKSDVRTFFDHLATECMHVLQDKERDMFADVEKRMQNMYNTLTGKTFKAPKESPSSPMSSVTIIIQCTTNELMDIRAEESNKMNQQEKDLKFCKMKLMETQGHLDKAIQDREAYLNRLSKVAGARLTHDNPDIADLSDPNRPTKIAESYSELYDNVWTDAFDIISRSTPDEETINILLKVLQAAYSYCSETSCKQNFLLITSLQKPTTLINMTEKQKGEVFKDMKALKKDSKKMMESMEIEVKKLLVDMRKSSWKRTLEDLSEGFQLDFVTKYWKNEHVKKYVHECLEITWLMVLQSPPLVLDDSVTRKANFDKSKYREYTQSGKKFDYLVWPALLICEGGSILQKGVAQGLK